MAKAQAGKVLIFALAAIISILVISFGFRYIRNLAEDAREKEAITFVKSVQSFIDTQSKRGSGSAMDKVFAAPKGVKSVCFVDNKKQFNEFTNNELTSNIEFYPESNFFILPLQNFMTEKLENLEVEESPLCVDNVNGKIRLKATSKLGTSSIQASVESDKKDECASVFYTSEPNQGVDIVFLGQFYKNSEDFKSDVYSYINDVFFNVEPFRSNRDKFNFYMVDKEMDLGCSFQGYVICNNYQVKKAASGCPHEFVFVLIDRNKMVDFLSPIRSSAVSNIANINTADSPSVVIHEFGHSFADLADEYVDDYYLGIRFDGKKYANCDARGCTKWAGSEGTSCIQGCSTNSYYRGTESSLMRSLSDESYGPINEKAIIEKLRVYRE
jgi:hypothetical protein